MHQRWRLQWWWYSTLGILAVVGVFLLWFNPQLPPQVQQLSKIVRPGAWSILLGTYLIAIVLTHLLVFYSTRLVRVLLNLHGEETYADLWSPALVGVCESIMYPTALILGKAEFIGVWLAVKVAGQWVRWRGEAIESASPPSIEILNEGRRRFNAFLVGNALSIMASFITWAALKIWALL